MIIFLLKVRILTLPKGKIKWQQVLSQIFERFGFYHNYPIGNY